MKIRNVSNTSGCLPRLITVTPGAIVRFYSPTIDMQHRNFYMVCQNHAWFMRDTKYPEHIPCVNMQTGRVKFRRPDEICVLYDAELKCHSSLPEPVSQSW